MNKKQYKLNKEFFFLKKKKKKKKKKKDLVFKNVYFDLMNYLSEITFCSTY